MVCAFYICITIINVLINEWTCPRIILQPKQQKKGFCYAIMHLKRALLSGMDKHVNCVPIRRKTWPKRLKISELSEFRCRKGKKMKNDCDIFSFKRQFLGSIKIIKRNVQFLEVSLYHLIAQTHTHTYILKKNGSLKLYLFQST